MPFGTLYRVAVDRLDVSENIWPPSSGFLRVDRTIRLCHHGITVTVPLHRGIYFWSKNNVFWDAFTAISIINVFWDYVPCSSRWNGRFGEHITSIFRVPQGDRPPGPRVLQGLHVSLDYRHYTDTLVGCSGKLFTQAVQAWRPILPRHFYEAGVNMLLR
jgi:hypothetical protein